VCSGRGSNCGICCRSYIVCIGVVVGRIKDTFSVLQCAIGWHLSAEKRKLEATLLDHTHAGVAATADVSSNHIYFHAKDFPLQN
jgi:hypothetical protein